SILGARTHRFCTCSHASSSSLGRVLVSARWSSSNFLETTSCIEGKLPSTLCGSCLVSIDGNWWMGRDVGMRGARDHRAHEHDADEEAAQDRSGYKEIDGSHDALRPMTHSHACKTDDAAFVFRSLRTIAVD